VRWAVPDTKGVEGHKPSKINDMYLGKGNDSTGSAGEPNLPSHLCAELRSYVENNEGVLIDYGQRSRAGKPISTSRAEGTVNQLVNARMNKRRQMRWSPRGAYRVLQVRAAVLDGRFRQQAIQLAA